MRRTTCPPFYLGKMKFIEYLKKKITRYDDTHNFTCDNCGREVFDGRRLCETCKEELPYNNGEICPFCGRRVREAGTCLDCKQRPLGVQKARSLFLYEGDAAALIRAFKSGKKYLYRTFVEGMLPIVEKEFVEADAVTFVPMTKKAQRRRGYNQSLLLAQGVCKATGKELIHAVEKKRENADQRVLTRQEREENMKNVFTVTDKAQVKGKRILIVDDTLTTGATASALAEVLKKAGAVAVYLITVASVEKQAPFGYKSEEEIPK